MFTLRDCEATLAGGMENKHHVLAVWGMLPSPLCLVLGDLSPGRAAFPLSQVVCVGQGSQWCQAALAGSSVCLGAVFGAVSVWGAVFIWECVFIWGAVFTPEPSREFPNSPGSRGQ